MEGPGSATAQHEIETKAQHAQRTPGAMGAAVRQRCAPVIILQQLSQRPGSSYIRIAQDGTPASKDRGGEMESGSGREIAECSMLALPEPTTTCGTPVLLIKMINCPVSPKAQSPAAKLNSLSLSVYLFLSPSFSIVPLDSTRLESTRCGLELARIGSGFLPHAT